MRRTPTQGPLGATSDPVPPVEAGDDLRKRLVALTLLRLAITGVILGAALLRVHSLETPAAHEFLAVLVAIFVASIGFALWLGRGGHLRRHAALQLLLDLFAWTAIVYLTGGPSSPLGFFLALVPLTAALTLGDIAANLSALAAVTLYGALTVAMSTEAIAPPSDPMYPTLLRGDELITQVMNTTIGVLLVGGLSGSLARRLRRTGGALARVEASRADLVAVHDDVLRSIPLALITSDSSGRIDGVNPVARTLLEAPPDALLHRSVRDWLPFLPPDAFEPGSTHAGADATLTVNGRTVPVAWRTAPLYDAGDRVCGGLTVVEDRTLAEQLRLQVARAERLAVLGRLTAGLAHEVRNPLGAISGCVELVRESAGLAPEDRALLGTVLKETERLNALVTDMLTFARPRAPQRSRMDAVEVADEVVALAANAGFDARIVAGDRPADGGAEVEADAAQIRQVLWNLVRNAVQASPAGGTVSLHVRCSPEAIELAVSDEGMGVPEATRERLFDAFETEGTRGTGLGLAIVKQIAEGHRARIEVRDRTGRGAEFALIIPRTDQA